MNFKEQLQLIKDTLISEGGLNVDSKKKKRKKGRSLIPNERLPKSPVSIPQKAGSLQGTHQFLKFADSDARISMTSSAFKKILS